ncbi:MAG: RDD family protein [Planctomycetes bacterium]|nr:RDD family protein [Planctomycetota bacterium]MBU1517645.1 RDD family protein [Planctomycetota bacterium]MBU2458666.1 RDD family protein [Planctomycetota bacterium]
MENSGQQLATRWKRLGGALLDSLIMIVIIFPIMMIIGIYPSKGDGMSFGQQILGSIISLVVFLILNGHFLAKSGQTIGKKIVQTKIVGLDGGLCPFARMFLLRYVVLWVITGIPFVGGLYGLFDVLFIFGKGKRCVHDYIAGTRVVDA